MVHPTLSLQSRLRGAVWGSLVGDALGVPVEFTSRAQRESDPVAEMRGHGTWNQRPGTWSDDGALLLCALEGLIGGPDPIATTAALFVRWIAEAHWTARGSVFDIGGTTHSALSRLSRGTPPLQAGGTEERSNGNGSLMRILPTAFAPGRTFAEKGDLAARLSCLTHAHPRSQLACAFFTVLAASLLEHPDLDAALAAARLDLNARLAVHPTERPHFQRLLHESPADWEVDTIDCAGYVLGTLEAALWCHWHHHNYRALTLAAVNLGGDTDTTACVAGGLAGLRFGEAAIPGDWLAALPLRAEVDALIGHFVSPTPSTSPT
jgi:ADP-ribosyl-[dinitrogen reductase] hydrolase